MYSQSTADLLHDRLNTLLNAETSLRLSALRLQQQALSATDLAGSTNGASQSAGDKSGGRHSITSRLKKRPPLLQRTVTAANATTNTETKDEPDQGASTSATSGLASNGGITSAASNMSGLTSTGNDHLNNSIGLSLDQTIAMAKSSVKQMERAYGLENFVPNALLHTMKKKELIKLIVHFYKQNQTQLIPNAVSLMSILIGFERRPSSDSTSIDSNSTATGASSASGVPVKLRSSELKRTIVTEQSVKLCFLNLLAECEAFGAKVFSVRKVSLDYRPNTLSTSDSSTKPNDQPDAVNGACCIYRISFHLFSSSFSFGCFLPFMPLSFSLPASSALVRSLLCHAEPAMKSGNEPNYRCPTS